MDYYDQNGTRIPLGGKLGSGGEGAVFDVPSLGKDYVAKIYHQGIAAQKQKKLLDMVAHGNEGLQRISAWPLATLHHKKGGAVCGFVMPKVHDYEPIHHLYGPAHRKQRFPKADWAFLIHTARNLAAAFDAIHSHGHVIGDVNQGNIYVARSSVIRLIDCDSFQIHAPGQQYLCEVGVAHFTPPELQNRSFHGIKRSPNHDNFGLAVLVFHLLMMGRHPYAGRFSGKGDMPIEKAISEYRYAFGRQANNKLMSPPPNSTTAAILPNQISEMFEQAFYEPGSSGQRPTASHWVNALEGLKGQLRSCSQESFHKFWSGSHCPWCTFERSNIFFFIAIGDGGTAQQISNFDLGRAWARIMAIESPGPAPTIQLSAQITPAPLPKEAAAKVNQAQFMKAGAVVLFLIWISVWPQGWFFALAVCFFMFKSKADLSEERSRRSQVAQYAEGAYNTQLATWRNIAGDERFSLKHKELRSMKSELEGLERQRNNELTKLQQNIRNSQLHRFLEGFFIEEASIPGIGSGRTATLSSNGVETAADITPGAIRKIQGFGPKLTGELLDWRKTVERKFVFDASKGVDPADVAAINQRFLVRRKQLEASLAAGYEQLTSIKNSILAQRRQLHPSVVSAYQRWQQARADLQIVL